MIQVTPQTRIFVATEPADFRAGMDGLARRCRAVLRHDPYCGAVFVFCNRARTAIKLLTYDGQGFWVCHKRMSKGRFEHWPVGADGAATWRLAAHELAVLLSGGDPAKAPGAPLWKPLAGVA